MFEDADVICDRGNDEDAIGHGASSLVYLATVAIGANPDVPPGASPEPCVRVGYQEV
jgi:hypothetical protein